MRRPLFAACLCLVILAALRLVWSGSPKKQEDYLLKQQEGHLLLDGALVTVTGQVCQKEEGTIYLSNLQLQSVQNKNITAAGLQQIPQRENQIKGKIICELKDRTEPPLGSTVLVSGIFRCFLSATNPGEFDPKVYYAIQNITGKLQETNILGQSRSFWRVREGLYGLKLYWRKKLHNLFPKEEATVMCAVLLGDKSQLDGTVKELYQRNGIIHILSISGLHITMIGMGIYRFLRRIGLPVWLAALVGGSVLVMYGILTGLGVSACRAIGMYLIRMLGEMIGRSYDMLTALGAVGAVMVLYNPLFLQHAGFLLSYGAVLGVGILLPVFSSKEEDCGKKNVVSVRYEENKWKAGIRRRCEDFRLELKKSICASAAITFFTMPILLWFYYEIPVYSLILNLCVLPLMKPFMAAGMAVMLLPGLGAMARINCLILDGYELLCRLFDKLPFHTWNPGQPQIWQIALYYLFLFAGMTFPAVRNRFLRKEGQGRRMRAGAIRALCLCAGVAVLGVQALPRAEVTFLDVGQGDGIFISTGTGENYLFDCGSTSRSKVGKYVLIPFLKQRGVSYLDAVFVSHPDKDHMSGIAELLKEGESRGITVGTLVLPDIETREKEEAFENLTKDTFVKVQYVKAGDSFGNGAFRAVCLHPPKGYGVADKNAYSECFYVEMQGGLSLLLTGDVEGEGETLLVRELEQRGIEEVTVLKVAHHGSGNATGEELLRQLRPRLAVISCGRDNSYGHPHDELVKRLKNQRCIIYQTAESGAITVRVKNGRAWLEEFFGNP